MVQIDDYALLAASSPYIAIAEYGVSKPHNSQFQNPVPEHYDEIRQAVAGTPRNPLRSLRATYLYRLAIVTLMFLHGRTPIAWQ